jgi:hypothetical protein
MPDTLVGLQPGDKAWFLSYYDLILVDVLKTNKNRVKIQVPQYKGCIAHTKSVTNQSLIHTSVPFTIVWERWKGRNGRGAYRIDTTNYPQHNKLGHRATYEYVYEDVPPVTDE